MKTNAQKSPCFIEAMQALAVEKLPEGDWLYEVKLDGYRALAFKDGKDVRLVSRNQKAFNYPQLLDALKSLPAGHLILDGEIVALDEKGRSSFQLLQVFKSSEQRVPLVYYAFDLLFLDSKFSLEPCRPSESRIFAGAFLRTSASSLRLAVSGSLRRSLPSRVGQEFGLEGLVAKRPFSVYESGRRSGAWVKVKITKSQEFVIGGYTLPEGSRKYFGALLVGYNSRRVFDSSAESGTAFQRNSLRASTRNCRNSNARLALSSTCRRKRRRRTFWRRNK